MSTGYKLHPHITVSCGKCESAKLMKELDSLTFNISEPVTTKVTSIIKKAPRKKSFPGALF